MQNKLLYKDESNQIQDAIFEVYREMGRGFLEAVYQECLEIELEKRGIPFIAQKEIQLNYKGVPLAHTYKPDLICYDCIIVEIKAVYELASEHKAQILNYLHATGHRLGLLANFGDYPKAVVERFIL